MSKFILLDRDGVINQDSLQYIKSVEEFKPLPGSITAIARLTAAGYKIGVATNQSGIARKLYSEAILQQIHQLLTSLVNDAGGKIDAIVYCPHLPEAGCKCRKPKPGMLNALAKQFAISLKGVPFVGDRVSDIQAAQAAGALPVMVLSAMTDREGLNGYPDIPVYQSLAAYVDQLLT